LESTPPVVADQVILDYAVAPANAAALGGGVPGNNVVLDCAIAASDASALKGDVSRNRVVLNEAVTVSDAPARGTVGLPVGFPG
jgi:hypothetical protein